MDDIKTTRTPDGKDYLAVIHADGNNLGITIARIIQNTSDYEEGIRARRIIDRNISGSYDRIMKATMADLRAYYEKIRTDNTDFAHVFQIIHQAGDDLNILCNAGMVFPFLEFFYRNLDGNLLFREWGLQIPLYVCTGIAFVTRKTSFASAFDLAEACCANAKKVAKQEDNLRDGLAGNWIDYQISDYPGSQDLELLRSRAFITRDDVNLLLRPYSVDLPDSEPNAYASLKHRIETLQQLKLSDEARTILRESYTIGWQRFMHWVTTLERKGTDLRDVLTRMGESICRDKDGSMHAIWYDALTLLDFYPANWPCRPATD